jgi:hypothetical protein
MKNALKLIWLTVAFFCSVIVSAQSYDSPESVEFDAKYQRYLVSNKGNAKGIPFILQTDMEGKNLAYFVNNLPAKPNALQIIGDTLYVATELPAVIGYLLSNGEEVVRYIPEGAGITNGLAADSNNNLYASDPKNKKIFRINVATRVVEKIADNNFPSVNGLCMDEENNRLLLCGWGTNAEINAIDLTSLKLTLVLKTPIPNIDGMEKDRCGNFYLSSYSQGKIYKYPKDFKGAPVLISSGHSGCADIDINKTNNILMVPNLNSHTVNFISLQPYCNTTSISQKDVNQLITVYSVPGRKNVIIESKSDFLSIDFYLASGIKIAGQKIYKGKQEVSFDNLNRLNSVLFYRIVDANCRNIKNGAILTN